MIAGDAHVTARSKALMEALRVATQKRLPPGTFLECPVPADRALAIAAIAALYEKEIVVFRNLQPEFFDLHGVVVPGLPHCLFINEQTAFPPLAVLGHELVHSMRREAPEFFDDLMLSAGPRISEESLDRYATKFRFPLDTESDIYSVYEEMVADLVGDQMVTPAFWQAMQERVEGPAADVCHRISGVVAGTAAHPLHSDEVFSDYASIATTASITMAVYGQWRRDGADALALLNLGSEGVRGQVPMLPAWETPEPEYEPLRRHPAVAPGVSPT